MEKWNHKSFRDHHQKRQNYRENPSFSSTLLDSIYRSIEHEGMKTEQKQRKQKQSTTTTMFRHFDDDDDDDNVGVVMVESKPPNKNNINHNHVRRNSLTEFDRRRTRSGSSNSFPIFSNSSSSDSSSGYGFSSSESESYKTQKLKPIRTSASFSSSIPPKVSNFEGPHKTQKANHQKNEGFAGRTKSKAFKMLKTTTTKQPISPGARLASFLNSLFHSSGGAKKAKVANSHESKSNQTTTSYCSSSSASSMSRSCLSKTPSSRSGGVKRSVRFCPVSVIVDEESRPCGQKKILLEEEEEEEEERRKEELRFHVMKESRRVEEFARELLKKKKKGNEFHMNYEEEEEDDDDGVSCASSDLFELENLSGIGIERYREELPVYETTHFNTNRAIANGFLL